MSDTENQDSGTSNDTVGSNILPDDLLIEQYSLLRSEIETRILMRRKLLAAGLAFCATFFGYAFVSSSSSGSNTWLISILPGIVAFLIIEVFRSERMLKKTAYHLQDIESRLLKEENNYGWETRYGGYEESTVGINNEIIIIMGIAYVAISSLSVHLWQNVPESLLFINKSALITTYAIIFLVCFYFYYTLMRIDPK